MTERACTDSLWIPWPPLLFAPMFNNVRKELVLAYLRREEEEAGRQTQRHTRTELGRARQNEKNRGTKRREGIRSEKAEGKGRSMCIYIERQRLGLTEERWDDSAKERRWKHIPGEDTVFKNVNN